MEDYEAYYKRQRADSFCGFAEEFEVILTLFYKNILLELLKKEAAAKSWTAVKSHLVRFDQMLVY